MTGDKPPQLTVASMIKLLQRLPPEAPIWFDYDGMVETVGGLRLQDGAVEILTLSHSAMDGDVAAELGWTVLLDRQEAEKEEG